MHMYIYVLYILIYIHVFNWITWQSTFNYKRHKMKYELSALVPSSSFGETEVSHKAKTIWKSGLSISNLAPFNYLPSNFHKAPSRSFQNVNGLYSWGINLSMTSSRWSWLWSWFTIYARENKFMEGYYF